MFCFVFAFAMQAQPNNFNSDLFPSFKEIAPSIHLLNSGYPNLNDLERRESSVTWDNKSETYKFIAKVITTDSLLNYHK